MPQHIGVVACSAEGAALCYRTICVEAEPLLGVHNHPEITMHTHALALYDPALERRDWPAVAEIMLSSARKLAAAGAEFLICPDNTIHNAMPFVLPRSPLPWLHIADAVTAEAGKRNFRRIALTGTRWLVETEVYPQKLAAAGIDFERPTAFERETIHRIIMDELVRGIFRPDSTAGLIEIIASLQARGCDAVILGCTELPLVLSDANSPLPTLDSTRLLARAALRHAIEPGS